MSMSGKVSQRRDHVSRHKGGEGRYSGKEHSSTGSGACQGHEGALLDVLTEGSEQGLSWMERGHVVLQSLCPLKIRTAFLLVKWRGFLCRVHCLG